MGFLLYHKEGPESAASFTLVRKLSMVGASGALTAWLRSNGEAELPMRWELSGERLIEAVAPDLDPASHALVMDMMPDKFAGAALCHVASLAGFTESDETDMVIVMRELSMKESPTYGTDMRKAFFCDGASGASDIIESIGISGGTRSGTYRWCAPKMNIGAAVRRAAPAKI